MNLKKHQLKPNYPQLKIKLTSNPLYPVSFRQSSLSNCPPALMQPKFKTSKNSRKYFYLTITTTTS